MSLPVVLIADKLAESTVAALGDHVEVRWVDGPNREKLLAAVPEADADSYIARQNYRLFTNFCCSWIHRLPTGCPKSALARVLGFSISIAVRNVEGATCAYRMVVVMLE